MSFSVSIRAQSPRPVSDQPVDGGEACEWLDDKLLAGLQLIEELAAQDEVSAVDPQVGSSDVIESFNLTPRCDPGDVE